MLLRCKGVRLPKAPYFNAKLTVSEGVFLGLSDVPKAV